MTQGAIFGLWPHQVDAVGMIESSWADGVRSVLYQLPTGGGKSRIIRTIVDNHAAMRKIIYIIAHRNTLVHQLSQEIAQADIKHGIIQAGSPFVRYRVQVCSMQTLVRRLDKMPEPSLIIADEAHHAKAASYQAILAKWPQARILGVTATPERPDGKGLDDIFDRLITGPRVADLMAAGFLSDYEYYAPEQIDMAGVRTRGGEFEQAETLARVDKPVITGSAIEHYRTYADHQPAIASCVSIAHSEHVAAEFCAAGYKAIAVNSTMEPSDVARAIAGLRDGSVDVLTQCEMLGEGVDVPGAVALIGLRPTSSLVIFLQHCGRVLRRADGKEKAIILDHVGNWTRFGLPDDDRSWSLQGRPKGKKEASAFKRCPQCLRVVAISARDCKFCGYSWAEAEKGTRPLPETVEGSLVNVRTRSKGEQQDLIRAIARRAHTLKQAIKIAQEMGYSHKNAYAIWHNELRNA